MNSPSYNRRDFLRGTGLLLAGSLATFGPAPGLLGTAAASPASHTLRRRALTDLPVAAQISLTAGTGQVQIMPAGQATSTWGYTGQVTAGTGATVQAVPNSYLGPIIRVKSGSRLQITVHNGLAEDTVLHPHGLRVPEECDGQPMQQFGPGLSKLYDFQVIDPACPAWFHPHPMGRTAEQVYMGLAGVFYVWDDAEALAVPGAATGANDIPVIIQDRLFDSNNQFLYQPNNMWGMLGNKILVNGWSNPVIPVEPRAYRLRFLNGSNARTYKLGWSNGMPLKVIGTDGGLLPAAVIRPYVMLMPGERVDVWADFASLANGQVILRSLSFDPGMMGGGMGMSADGMAGTQGMGGGCPNCGGGGGGGGGGMGGLANGAAFDILRVTVGASATSNPVLGPLPPLSETYNRRNVGNWRNPVPFTLAMQHMVWTINGRVYNMNDMTEVADDEMVTCGEPIAWQWINNSPIPHPMHIHSTQFQVVERISPGTSAYATVNQGFLDTGWKDVVSVWPGERVKIAWRPGPYTGMYMYHCHILEHEDMTMMRNYMIMDPM